jgi:uncharacterized zinc-type alcohol dehydrogenase-like protein
MDAGADSAKLERRDLPISGFVIPLYPNHCRRNTMTTIHGYAAQQPNGKLQPFEYQAGEPGHDEVEIDVIACGICHSDLSMIDNEWGMSEFPLIAGHEATGKISAKGAGVAHLNVGQAVGLGWMSSSCMTCQQCMSGDHNFCAHQEATVVGRHGGFADKVR